MATRTKTVQYAFPMNTGVITNATVTNLTQITLYIPETIFGFDSVTVDMGFQDVITATGGSISEHRVGLSLGAAAYSTIANTATITNSGEEISAVVGPWDFTSYFSSNWSGTSETCDLQVYFNQSTGTTLGMRNVTAIISITYRYDDTSASHTKTAWIPLESLVGSLPTVANSNFGTSQIPQLTGSGGFLPESGVTILDYFFVIEGNESTAATTDFTLSANIDSATATAFGTQEAGLNSDRFCRWIFKPASIPSTTATHNFQLWSSLAARCNHVTVVMVVTYQFTPASSSTILNSLMLPVEMTGPLGSPAAIDASRMFRTFFVQEPGTITMLQSAVRVNYNCAATPTGLRISVGSQAFRIYTPYAGAVAGMFCLQQRIDSGSSQGSSLTLARGQNTINVDGYVTSTVNQATNVSGYVILNYQSAKASDGVGAHAHSLTYNQLQWTSAKSDRTRVDGYALTIPESAYFFVGIGFVFYQLVQTAAMGITFDVECLSTEGKGGGYYDIYSDAYQQDNELACSIIWMRGRDVFWRFPGDPGADRVDISVARSYRLFTSVTTANGLMAVITYHSINYTVSGTVTGSAGGSVIIRTYRTDTREVINQTTQVGNGSYSFTWYDNTIPLFTEASEDTTHRGRSQDGLAGTSLDVVLTSPVVRSYA